MMGDHGNPQKKRSIDEIIEHMTADIQPSDGQYIPLGFTPPPTPANAPRGWSEYAISSANSIVDNQSYTSNPPMTNARENPVFLPDVSGVHFEFNAAHLPKQIEVPGHHDFYFAGATLQQQQLNVMTENREIIGTVVDNGGNIVNVVYSGSNVLSPQYHMMSHDGREPMKLPLGGFIPYQSNSIDNRANPLRDYGLFNSSDVHHQPQQNRQQAQPFHGVMNNRVQLIENLVGNWVPNQSGTYSPFGCMDNGVRQIPSTNQQGIQTVPMSTESDVECNRGVGRGVRKARIVAEVRPMRPTYSDVLSKSAPTTVQAVKPNSINVNSANKPESLNIIKSKTNTSKNNGANKKNNKSSTLKRQHSSGSDEHNYNGIINCGKLIQNAVSSQKSVDIDIKDNNSGIGFNSMPRKWVSLDDLDSDKQMSGELDNEIFQSEGLISKTLRQRNEGNNKKLGMTSSKSKYGQQDDFLGTTLNNHKPPAYAAGGKCPGGLGGAGTKRPPIHINNNLGTSTWSSSGTGGGAGGSGGGSSSGGGSNGGTGEKNILKGSSGAKISRNCQEDKKGSKSDAKIGTTGTNSTKSSLTRSSSVSGSHGVGVSEKPTLGKRRGKRKECQSPLALICRPFKRHVTHWGQLALQIVFWFIHLLSDVLSMSVRLLIHLCVFVYDWLCTWSVHAWISLRSAVLQLRLLERLGFHGRWWNFGRNNGKYSGNGQSSSGSGVGGNFKDGFPPGLENNISLPSTGEEAMRRLLACKGKDPYSILGVTPHCTDEDIKKYYKRQAVLVHPDKNNQPGAEEAFKILVHAFELIGEPERRTAYDRRVAETQQVEQAWSELSDLLSQLHKKMEYAANTIRCTNCGKRHRRIHVDRPCYAARFCSQCKIHHNAREGDIWAESSMFGFLWHYYACMDGGVYDITEWAACQAENLRHLRANTHIVQYRIVLGKQSQQQSHSRHHNSRTNQRTGPDSNSEPDLEDFLNNLYNQSGGNGVGEGGRSDQGRNRKKGKRKK